MRSRRSHSGGSGRDWSWLSRLLTSLLAAWRRRVRRLTEEAALAHLRNGSLDSIENKVSVFICVRSRIETVTRFADVNTLLEHVVVKDVREVQLAREDEAE